MTATYSKFLDYRLGAEVRIGDQIQTEVPFRSSYETQPEMGYRVSYSDWNTTTIKLPGAVIAGDELLSLSARVGTSDGTVNGATDGDTRFVYSRLVETEINLNLVVRARRLMISLSMPTARP